MKHRGSIHVEDTEVLSHEAHGDLHVLRLHAPKTAAAARPGSFVHLSCDAALPMRRPFSIMRSGRDAGWIDILYRALGEGTRLLTQRKPGERLSMIGPIGQPFVPHAERSRPLLIGGGVGMPPMVFLADELRKDARYRPLVLMGSEVPFPFRARPSQIVVPGIPTQAIAAMPLLDDWGIPSRLSSLQGYAGCFEGYVTDLARAWLGALSADERAQVEIFACGPHPMLAATARLASKFGLPCQVSLEEFMACAVGGCAGCAVRINTLQGPAMKRVCVDGPVFDATVVQF
ncbi:MAG: dihydroorotate dehydrogenase electron transfer subunit [Chromatiales bacterium]|jgi:dihydroorotate dehydrogenase electron transfer subunit|nr:dihydroorotate dehydrogenase electron transfer subunit [Chromatiales bacterium]